MAERPKGYGLTAELEAKKAAKYDENLAQEAVTWIEEITGEAIGATAPEELSEILKDGKILCQLANVINPGVIPKVNQSKMAFKMMENINFFLAACEGFGIQKGDLFQTVDLYEAQNMPQVINGIHALGRKVQKMRPDLPYLGPKESDKQERDFSEEQLRAGKGVIGLQMGSNKGASQAGMTPYGLGRQIEKTNLKN